MGSGCEMCSVKEKMSRVGELTIYSTAIELLPIEAAQWAAGESNDMSQAASGRCASVMDSLMVGGVLKGWDVNR